MTVLEVMPVADFPGRFGWGYDGVNLFAPCRLYGEPDAMRRFVDRAHAEGLAVILDVVYNHLGPDGNFLPRFAPAYFSDRYKTEWGEALNFDGEDSGPVREFVLANAGYWVEEFHVDGLRVDATQSLFDTSDEHIVAAIARRVREAAGGRRTLVVGENEPQDVAAGPAGRPRAGTASTRSGATTSTTPRWSPPPAAARGITATTAARPRSSSRPAGAGSSARGNGTPARGSGGARRPPGSTAPGSSSTSRTTTSSPTRPGASGSTGSTGPGRYRALTALLLLGSGTPYLFQGQEFAASSPFLYFGDLEPEIAEEMHEGRRTFLKQFASLATPEMQARVPAPARPRHLRPLEARPRRDDRAGTPRHTPCMPTC